MMKIGVIADTHDNMPMIAKAIDVFNSEGCRLVIHAGDYCAPFSLNSFSKLKCKWIGVFGNNDGEKKGLAMKSNGLIVNPPYRYDLSDKKALITHEIEDIEDLKVKIDRGEYSIIICAHTHKVDIKKEKNTLIVNPGECGGWLYGKSTVAIVDLEKLEAKEIVL